jgi:hypothetical protein
MKLQGVVPRTSRRVIGASPAPHRQAIPVLLLSTQYMIFIIYIIIEIWSQFARLSLPTIWCPLATSTEKAANAAKMQDIFRNFASMARDTIEITVPESQLPIRKIIKILMR